MKFPYSQVHVHDGIIFATRSGRIESFDLHNGNKLSTWIHPDTENFVNSIKPVSTEVPDDSSTVEPPTKRQKTSEVEEEDANSAKTEGNPQDESPAEGGAKKGPKQPRQKQVDRPVVPLITGTTDGKHIVALSGQDKAIWVFEHDGQGQLKQLSKRVMPKRPNAVVIGPGSRIISADKFGDVYDLPLIPDESSAAATVVRRPAAGSHTKPAADELTVHSKRNLASLQFQRQQAEAERQRLESGEPPKKEHLKADVPDFELTLLLGHVSVVTSIVLGENQGRPVIITGDRDEHVRVSRYIPQAHVIEGFCHGHREFVNSLVIPGGRGNILISGGGDNELFIWNWQTNSLLSQTNVLSLAQEIVPEATKVAVSKLVSFDYTSESGTSTCVLAICEGIKAVFSWHLTEANELKFPSIIQVPGNPLDLTLAQSGTELPSLVIALDTSEAVEGAQAESLNVYDLETNEGKLAVGAVKPIPDSTASSEADVLESSAGEIKRTLYGIESMRKVRVDYDAEAGEDADVGEGPEE